MSLIELLIVVSILAFLGTAVFGVFSQGLRLWKRSAGMQPDLDSDVVFEKITDDLRGAYPSSLGAFKGDETSLQLFGYALPREPSLPGGLRLPARVTYTFRDGVLERTEEPYQTVLTASVDAGTPAPRRVAPSLRECRFEYYHRDPKSEEYQWKSFWQGDCLPKAVRVSLKFDDEKKMHSKVKVIALPAGRDFCPAAA
jgi:hypothetical protein